MPRPRLQRSTRTGKRARPACAPTAHPPPADPARRHYAIKAAVRDPGATSFDFPAQKTMYGGKRIAAGDTVFVFASENEGGPGLIAAGTVTSASALPRAPGIARQTPRVSLTVRRTAAATRPLGRAQLKGFARWGDGRPETELNFKFYRQATNKVAGLTAATAAFLQGFMAPDPSSL